MVKFQENRLIGLGIYSVPEAGRLTGVAPARIRRWLVGYEFKSPTGTTRASKPLWRSDFIPIENTVALSFQDLIEIRFVDTFLKAGVSWREIRAAAAEAANLIQQSHPFASQRFKTDGRNLFMEVNEALKQPWLLRLTRSQYEFHQVVAPSLFEGLEYQSDELLLWRPKSGQKRIVLDPQRSFGQPITDEGSVPTNVLASAVKAEGEGSVNMVARWYGIAPRDVSAAVKFEESLVAKPSIRIAA